MTNNEWKKLHLALPLQTRLRYWAQNEDMIDQYYTMRGADMMDAADRIEQLESALRLVAQNDYGLQSMIEDGTDSDKNRADYYAGQVSRRQNIARTTLGDKKDEQ